MGEGNILPSVGEETTNLIIPCSLLATTTMLSLHFLQNIVRKLHDSFPNSDFRMLIDSILIGIAAELGFDWHADQKCHKMEANSLQQCLNFRIVLCNANEHCIFASLWIPTCARNTVVLRVNKDDFWTDSTAILTIEKMRLLVTRIFIGIFSKLVPSHGELPTLCGIAPWLVLNSFEFLGVSFDIDCHLHKVTFSNKSTDFFFLFSDG